MSTSHTLPPLPELDAIASTVMRIVGLQKGAARHVAEITLEYMAQDRAALASTAAVQAALSSQAPAALYETDIYDFAGWLTTRPGVMPVGSTSEAGPMAEAVGEYIKTYPERFAALQSRQPAAPAEQEPYTTIDMGHGKWEVGAGKNADLPCIAFGRNGTGKVGEPITTEPRQMSVEETFAVITFANVDGLDVLQDKMDQVREEFFPGTVCQFSQPAAPAAPVAPTEATRDGCNYSATTGSICNKCGHVHGPAAPVAAVLERKLIGWRTENFLWETDDPDRAKNWEPNIGVLPIFEGDPNTKLQASPTPPVQPAVFTLDELVDACVAAEVPDSKFEALSIYLTAAQAEGGASEPQ